MHPPTESFSTAGGLTQIIGRDLRPCVIICVTPPVVEYVLDTCVFRLSKCTGNICDSTDLSYTEAL